MDKDYTKCEVCGLGMGVDKLHIVIDNGRVMRHTYCCRKHRYVMVAPPGQFEGGVRAQVQSRTDLEIESLAHAFRLGELPLGWE